MSNAFAPTPAERAFLLARQREVLAYFLDNQAVGGLILDRQANHRELRRTGWCSSAATGMGLLALALAAEEPYRLLSAADAATRVRGILTTALTRLPHDHGILPHFVDAVSGEPRGSDAFSTVDTSWLVGGALGAAALLADPECEALATQLAERIDWRAWSDARGLIRHGRNTRGEFLDVVWDRINGETILLYVLAAGAAPERALVDGAGASLRTFTGTVAGLRFNNADLGLFAFEYGLDLFDVSALRGPGGLDLAGEAQLAALANQRICQEAAPRFATYRQFWGLSDGDGPGVSPETDTYRADGPGFPLDGTAHLSATLAAVALAPAEVFDNLYRAESDPALRLRGRYGYSSVNLDRHWVGCDAVGIDAGAAVLALDNCLMDNRLRRTFARLPWVSRGLQRLGFTRTGETVRDTDLTADPSRLRGAP
jgi:hypothetical protein